MSARFGEKLRSIRTTKRVTLEELATAVGSSKAYIWQLENKKTAKPTGELLLKIADFFGESPDYFVDDSIETREERSENQVESAFFRKFKKLSESDKRYIERIVYGLNQDEKDS